MAVLEAALANYAYFILFLVISIVLYVWGVIPYRRSTLVAITGDLPGPKPLPIIGHLLDFRRNNYFVPSIMNEYYRKYGRVYAVYVGRSPAMMICDPPLLKEIFVKKFTCFTDRNNDMFPFGNSEPFNKMVGLIKGDEWQRLRSAHTPSFTTHKLKVMIPLIQSSCDVFMRQLEQAAKKGKPFHIHEYNQAFILEIFLKTMLGLHTNAQLNYDDPAFVAVREAAGTGIYGILQLIAFFVPILGTMFPRIYTAPYDNLMEMLKQVIETRKKDRSRQSKDFLDLILKASDGDMDERLRLSDSEICANCVLFLNVGFDTTSAMLSFICHCLATHPDVQEKLQQEIECVWTEEDELPSYDKINEMKYLDMVVSETLRLYPTGYVIVRECTEDCVINGLHFKKGVAVYTDVYSIHRDPEYYPDPDKFIPERFSAESTQSRDPYTFLPFGHGQRFCIGKRLAIMILKLVLVRVLKKFQIVPAPDTKLVPPLVLGAMMDTIAPRADMALIVQARH